MGCWNIRRGLVKREHEIIELLNSQKLNILFLVETDTNVIQEEKDYKIKGYRTFFPLRGKDDLKTRIICLVDENLDNVSIRTDLMNTKFPSIWCEVKNETERNFLCCGLYREWSHEGVKSNEVQLEAMKIFCSQMEKACKEKKNVIVQGDVNLCAIKWLEADYNLKFLSDELLSTLALCGLENVDLGNTYLADRLTEDGKTIESALDHTYITTELKTRSDIFKLDKCGTDHLPIMISVKSNDIHRRTKKNVKIIKRSMKNFNATSWNANLATKNWEKIGETENVSEMATTFAKLMNEALDEIAPLKTFTNKDYYKPGLSPETKELMSERDQARREIKHTKGDKWIALQKYKTLRNRVTNQLRNDTLTTNGKRIDEAQNESEYWKIINDINKPNSETKCKLNDGVTETENEEEVATRFNQFFVNKVEGLKANIDPALKEDPLHYLEKNVKQKNLKFTLKTVTVKTVTKIMKKMKKKKSSGTDGITQECLLLGVNVLAIPLTHIINTSIMAGEVPEPWKEAIVVPILKKGDSTNVNNYRPVSLLCAASKVMEKVVCIQIVKFMENNGLLPENQHGFRTGRSTMTALTAMQREWIRNSEDGLVTGILVWDLSAAFDTVDTELLCLKLKLYGFDRRSCAWFRSFLTGRSQRVRMGSALSPSLSLTTGVPQGGTLSPIIFTVYTADLELWVKKSRITNYADDTTSDTAHEELEMVLKVLEGDAAAILAFMASNGLVANTNKTVFMLLNHKSKNEGEPVSVLVGNNEVTQEHSTKLLGMQISDKLTWKEHFHGKNGLTASLNKRLFAIRRVANHIPKSKLIQLAHAIWMSKLRYGLQLCTNVRNKETERKNGNMKSVQIAQNKLMRLLTNATYKDKTPTKELLEKTGFMSVNQLAASIKLTEVWKGINIDKYPIRLEPNEQNLAINGECERVLRPSTCRLWNQDARTNAEKECFSRNAAKIWNEAPLSIKNSIKINSAKKEIIKYCKALPV